MDKEQQKTQLEANLKLKNEELDALKSKVLTDQEKLKKENLEKEIEDLQVQLDEFEELEAQTTVTTTQEQTDDLKTSIEEQTEIPTTYSLIQGTNMETQLQGLDKNVEQFAEDIDAIVRKFYDKELEGFSESVKNGLCVGTQFAMMETLTADGANGTSFFESFSQTDTGSGIAALGGIFKAFSGGIGGILGKVKSGTKFFDLANSIQNFTGFLKINKNLISSSTSIPELMNPYKLKQTLLNPMWNDENAMYTTSVSSVLSLDSTEGIVMSVEEEAGLKAIANNPNMPINEKTIAAIEKSLGTADKFLDAREKYQDSATSLMQKASSFFNIEIPLLGSLGALFDMEWPLDFIRNKEGKNKLLNFVLKVIGFPGGVEGLHAKYIKENIQLTMTDDVFVKTAYQTYQTGLTTSAVQNNDDPQSTWKRLENKFSGLKAEQKTALKSKIPPQYDVLKKSIVEALDKNSNLNPNAVRSFAPEVIGIVDGKQEVDVTRIINKEAFAEKYLQFIVPKLVSSGTDFISSPEVNPNTFALAIFGNLIADKFFVEGVNIGIVNINDYQITNSEQLTTNNAVEGLNVKKQLNELSFVEAKLFAQHVFGKGPATNLLIKLSKDNPAMILRTIAIGKHEGGLKFGLRNKDPNTASGQINIGTFQLSAQPNQIVEKYNRNLQAGLDLLTDNGITYDRTRFRNLVKYEDKTGATNQEKAQCDLVSWLGYVYNERDGHETFDKLADANLSNYDLKHLISKTIQGGIPAIGEGVVNQINTNKVSYYSQLDISQVA